MAPVLTAATAASMSEKAVARMRTMRGRSWRAFSSSQVPFSPGMRWSVMRTAMSSLCSSSALRPFWALLAVRMRNWSWNARAKYFSERSSSST
jgi:hypothetical protein